MSQMKTRLQALNLLDRAFHALTDDELAAAVEALPDDHRGALDELADAPAGGFTDPAARVVALRHVAARGRVNGGLEQVATVLTDPALAKCIELLGDHADNPTEEQLLAITPQLVDEFSVPIVRLMLASSVTGEATAAPMLMRVLKHDDTLALPPAELNTPDLVPARQADDETKARRKAAKERKQADARARRSQQQRAKNT